MRQRAAVDANDQVMVGGECRHGLVIGAIAFVDTVRDIERRAVAHVAQPDEQQRSGRAAIHVVVSENRDAFTFLESREKPRRRCLHIAQAAWVGQQVAQGGGQKARRLGVEHAAAGQHLAHRVGQARALNQQFRRAGQFHVRADPAPPGQGCFDTEKAHADLIWPLWKGVGRASLALTLPGCGS